MSTRLIAIVAFLALITVPCIAVPDTVTTGPYKISFDLGIPKEAYKVDIAVPKTKEALSGDISTTYNVELINKTGILRRATIILTSYETEQVIPLQDELVKMEKYVLLQIDGLYDIEVAGRKIDGYDGAIGSGTLRSSGIELDSYAAIYYPSSTTTVSLISSYPWEDGTLQLLKSIHIEKINAIA